MKWQKIVAAVLVPVIAVFLYLGFQNTVMCVGTVDVANSSCPYLPNFFLLVVAFVLILADLYLWRKNGN